MRAGESDAYWESPGQTGRLGRSVYIDDIGYESETNDIEVKLKLTRKCGSNNYKFLHFEQ